MPWQMDRIHVVDVGTRMVILLMTLVLRNVVGGMPWKMDWMRDVEVGSGMVILLILLMTCVQKNDVGVMQWQMDSVRVVEVGAVSILLCWRMEVIGLNRLVPREVIPGTYQKLIDCVFEVTSQCPGTMESRNLPQKPTVSKAAL